MKKKFTAFAVCLMMIAALACPADAAAAPRDSGVSPMAEGNGYTSDSFQYGGNYYGLYITAEYSTGSGARTKAWSSLYDHVYVKLSDVTVNYVHKNYPNTTEKGGAKAAKDIEELVSEVTGMFAGGELSEDAIEGAYKALTDAYWIAKENNKKYAPKTRRKKSDQ